MNIQNPPAENVAKAKALAPKIGRLFFFTIIAAGVLAASIAATLISRAISGDTDATNTAYIVNVFLFIVAIKLCSRTLKNVGMYQYLSNPIPLFPELYKAQGTVRASGEPVFVLYEVSLAMHAHPARKTIEDAVQHSLSMLDEVPTPEEVHAIIDKSIEIAWPYLHINAIAFRVIDITLDTPRERDGGTPIGRAL